MLFQEWDQEVALKVAKEEAMEKGIEKGIVNTYHALYSLLTDKRSAILQTAKQYNKSEKEILRILQAYNAI